MINPQWLRTFTTLAELGSFTQAAERLGLTQAAVSQHIRQLEERYGTLLIRRPRQIELTPAGQILLDYSAEIARLDQRLHLRLSEPDADCGEVSVISPGSIGLAIYPLLLDFQKMHPGLVIRHRFAPDSEVLEGVLQNRFELGLITQRPDDVRIAACQFAEEPLELVVPAGVEINSWQDLVKLGFIDHPDGQGMANRLLSRRFPGEAQISELPRRGFSNQVGLLLEPVARGLGFTVLPRYARQAFAHQDAIRVVSGDVQVIDKLWLIHRAEWPLSNRAIRVLQYLREQVPGADFLVTAHCEK
jgi:DNA-binding transcriptional LysR family regulator